MRRVAFYGSMILFGAAYLFGENTMTLSQLSETTLQDFSKGVLRDIVLECREGDHFPLKVSIEGEFLNWDSSSVPINLTILQTCFIRCTNPDHFLFSTDGETWKEFIDFFTGDIGAGLKIQNNELQGNLHCELNHRKK
jgi:hypothetical protein